MYARLEDVLTASNNTGTLNTFKNFEYMNVSDMYIVSAVLSEGNSLGVSDSDLIGMAKLAAWSGLSLQDAMELGETKLRDYIYYGKDVIYTVETSNGVRFATENEICEGVTELRFETRYTIDVDTEYRYLNSLLFLLYGRGGALRDIGYNIKYSKERQIVQPLMEIIEMAKYDFANTLKWIDSGGLYSIKKGFKAIKDKRFKYTNYAEDEIKPSIKIKQIVHDIASGKIYRSSESDYRRAWSICKFKPLTMKGRKAMDFRGLITPEERRFIRVTAKKYSDVIERKPNFEGNIEDIASRANELIEARDKHRIDPTEFVFKVIDTLKRNSFKRVSDKQAAIVNEAYSTFILKVKGGQQAIGSQRAEKEKQMSNMSDMDYYKSIFGGGNNSVEEESAIISESDMGLDFDSDFNDFDFDLAMEELSNE